jgi:D-glycero-D-manno-heptose 1,7-bisphosphate phosphatase
MANRAVFLDRDNTIIEDPGYLSEPEAVKLLPGVELAIKSFAQAGFKVVVVTNQSGVARGLFTEEALDEIHNEMRRQLSAKGARIDGLYYCPFHPEGTVDAFAVDSDLRKPKPGMLLKAAREMDLDLAQSWMIGDSGRDVEAGQRAGCHTIRIRSSSKGPDETPGVQADFVVRNLVDAARIVMREVKKPSLAPARATSDGSAPGQAPSRPERQDMNPPTPAGSFSAKSPDAPATKPRSENRRYAPPVEDAQQRYENLPPEEQIANAILRQVRETGGYEPVEPERFSFSKLFAGVVQVLAVGALLFVLSVVLTGGDASQAILWALIAIVLQIMALTFYIMKGNQ